MTLTVLFVSQPCTQWRSRWRRTELLGRPRSCPAPPFSPRTIVCRGSKCTRMSSKVGPHPAPPAGVRSTGQGTRDQLPEHPVGTRVRKGRGGSCCLHRLHGGTGSGQALDSPSCAPASPVWEPAQHRGVDGPEGPAWVCTSRPCADGEHRRGSAVSRAPEALLNQTASHQRGDGTGIVSVSRAPPVQGQDGAEQLGCWGSLRPCATQAGSTEPIPWVQRKSSYRDQCLLLGHPRNLL